MSLNGSLSPHLCGVALLCILPPPEKADQDENLPGHQCYPRNVILTATQGTPKREATRPEAVIDYYQATQPWFPWALLVVVTVQFASLAAELSLQEINIKQRFQEDLCPTQPLPESHSEAARKDAQKRAKPRARSPGSRD
ncbi:hypothetical protein QBC36DRAFT_315806 [Triangularia setosa]|uniref:Uncharacterized protein n=1 Tax=Triangularia setosa TaxID=2587417 RepID=A0AAN7A2A5_9PEZI|nr:hypothetical protein QBC36DRAFT_315806 [Podospora setosa]